MSTNATHTPKDLEKTRKTVTSHLLTSKDKLYSFKSQPSLRLMLGLHPEILHSLDLKLKVLVVLQVSYWSQSALPSSRSLSVN